MSTCTDPHDDECLSWALVFIQSDVERHTLAKYLMELTLIDYEMVHYRPSEIAAAALCLSQLLLNELPWVSWTVVCNFTHENRGPEMCLGLLDLMDSFL